MSPSVLMQYLRFRHKHRWPILLPSPHSKVEVFHVSGLVDRVAADTNRRRADPLVVERAVHRPRVKDDHVAALGRMVFGAGGVHHDVLMGVQRRLHAGAVHLVGADGAVQQGDPSDHQGQMDQFT